LGLGNSLTICSTVSAKGSHLKQLVVLDGWFMDCAEDVGKCWKMLETLLALMPTLWWQWRLSEWRRGKRTGQKIDTGRKEYTYPLGLTTAQPVAWMLDVGIYQWPHPS